MPDFSTREVALSVHNGLKIELYRGEQRLTTAAFFEELASDDSFRYYFNGLLSNGPYPAFFWETPAMKGSTLQRNFEMVMIDSPILAMRKPDPVTFRAYFKSSGETAVFPSLRNDALLMVPSPQTSFDAYPHIGAFVRQAPLEQIDQYWKVVAQQVLQTVDKEWRWLSTSGMGVSWLHVRLDSRPKYYVYKPYKLAH